MKHERATRTGAHQRETQSALPGASKRIAPHPLHQLQQALGNRAFSELLQAKLKVSQPGNAYEQEADRVADQIMRMPDPARTQITVPELAAAPTHVQRACSDCEEEEDERQVHRKTAACDEVEQQKLQLKTSGQPGNKLPAINTRIDQVGGGGEPLVESVRAYFEPRFARDFGQVRIHKDNQAAEAARSVNALAYTVGRDVVFGSGQYAPETEAGQRLLAHELTHVIQQRGTADPAIERQPSNSIPSNGQVAQATSRDGVAAVSQIQLSPANLLQRTTGETDSAASGSATGSAGGAPTRAAATGFEVDVLAAEERDDNFLRAAARALGVDIHVSSLEDMINQLETRTSAGTCVRRLNIYNHANPSIMAVSGGGKTKSPTGERIERPLSGFSLDWLTANADQVALNRLRHSFCCDSQMNWFGCSTAGVWAEGGTRTAAERAEDEHRYTGVLGNFYHDVAEAAAHGATRFRYIGMVNVQSWANALCTPVLAATDFNNFHTVGSEVVRTLVHGGRQVRVPPQGDVGCACDPATGRVSGSAQTSAQLQQRAGELRSQFLRPLYEQTRGVIGTTQPLQAESEAERTTRLASEQAQTASFEQLGSTIRDAVLASAGFAAGARPSTADEALRVVGLWDLNIDSIATRLPTLTTALSGMLSGSHEEAGLDQTQRDLEAALTPTGRESFMAALMLVRRERFWNDYLTRNTIYFFPDLTAGSPYSGITQIARRTSEGNRPQRVCLIHVRRDRLNAGQTELVAANMVHELSHCAYETERQAEPAMLAFNTDLAGLIADHPRVVQLRAAATDPAAARSTHISRIRQMLYEATGYAEEEIFVHLQQLTHQPSMTIDGAAVRGSDVILEQVEQHMRRLRRIGMPPRVLNQVFAAILREAGVLYDRRIAAAPAGSTERQLLEVNKHLAMSIFQLAFRESANPPRTP